MLAMPAMTAMLAIPVIAYPIIKSNECSDAVMHREGMSANTASNG